MKDKIQCITFGNDKNITSALLLFLIGKILSLQSGEVIPGVFSPIVQNRGQES